jgi:hypothetical protein
MSELPSRNAVIRAVLEGLVAVYPNQRDVYDLGVAGEGLLAIRPSGALAWLVDRGLAERSSAGDDVGRATLAGVAAIELYCSGGSDGAS